jgi:hypothetical protein
MRDDDAVLPRSTQSLPPTVVQQPDPLLDQQPAGWFSVALTMLGAGAVVALVLYGVNRPPEPQQMATSTEQSQTAPATAGQGSGGGQAAQSGTAEGQSKGQTGPSKAPPASGSSAGSDTGPGAKPAPAAK